jgi:hypothetical protein
VLDFAQVIPEGIDAPPSQAETMGWGMAQRHTHLPASLEATFAPAEARRVPERRVRHDTPMPGCGLKMAETDLSVLTTHGVDVGWLTRPPDVRRLLQGHRDASKARCLAMGVSQPQRPTASGNGSPRPFSSDKALPHY